MFKDKAVRNAYMKKYMQPYLKRRYDDRRARAVELLGGCCAECGSTDRLQFDHVDPSTKEFEIADRIAQYAWPRIIAELAKCQLLCFDCHVAKHTSLQAKTPRLAAAALA